MVYASMRPRHYAADNRGGCIGVGALRLASMRPRHYAADNRGRPSDWIPPSRSFNEAAALRRG